MRSRFPAAGCLLVCAAFWLPAGCADSSLTLAQKFQSDDPDLRRDAIREAARTGNAQALPYLVDRLQDSEDDIRFYAIEALQRMTGQTLGYVAYEPSESRLAAVKRWREWLKGGRATAPAPVTEERKPS
jgi:HEAT repeat protein